MVGRLAALCTHCPVRATCLRTGRRTHDNGLHAGVVLLAGVIAPGTPQPGAPATMTVEPPRDEDRDALTSHARNLADRRVRVAELHAAGLTTAAMADLLGVSTKTITADRRHLRDAEQPEPAPPGPAAHQHTARRARPTRAQRRRQRGTRWR